MKDRKYLLHPSLYNKSAQNTQGQTHAPPAQEHPPQEAPQDNVQHRRNIFHKEEKVEQPKKTVEAPKPFENENIRKFPRPLITSHESKERIMHSAETYEELPKAYYDYVGIDSGNATCRFARSSMYLVPENASNFSKSNYKFSILYTPLAETHDSENQVPMADKRESVILRCERCGCFVNPNFIFKDNWEKYVCNLCEMQGKVPANFINRSNPQPGDHPETQYGVYDFIVPDSYCLNEVKGHDVLFCFDMSYESLINGSFFYALTNITAFLESFEEDTNLGFLLFDNVVSFFKVSDEEDDDEVTIIRNIDPENSTAPSRAEIFMNAKRERNQINKILAFLQKFAETQYNEKHAELKATVHCLETLGKALEECFKANPGNVVIFTSTFKKVGNEVVKYKDVDKAPNIKPKIPTFTKIGETLAQKGVTVNLFVTADKQIELSTFGELSLRTGGQIFYYNNFKSQADSEKFYYDLYRLLTAFRGFDVVCRIRVSSGLQILNYHTPKGKLFTLDFQLGSLTSDQHIVADLQIGENLKDKKAVHVQFVTLYTNSYGTRIMRIINLSLKLTNDMTTFFKNLDCDSFTYSFMREGLERAIQKTGQEASEETLKHAYKIFKYYRYDIGGRYEPREFALPDRIKFFPLYLSTILSRPCFNQKTQVNNQDYNYYSMVSMSQMHITKLVYSLYPKIFDIAKMFNDWKQGHCEAGYPNDNELVTLPDSIPANLILVKTDGLYLCDNGEMLFLNVRREVNPELLQQLFGVDSFAELQTPCTLQPIETDFSNLLHSVIGRLRTIKSGAIQSVLVIAENDDNVFRLRSTFVEDLSTPISSHYWDFLSQLHEKVKDE